MIEVPPRFRIASAPAASDDRTIVLAPSAAFGDGTHETTRMCLQALAAFAPRRPFRLLDVGSGTGILSIGAAKLGGEAVGVEIDPEANVAARANARLNGVLATFDDVWPDGTFDVVVANILRAILVGLAPRIARATARTLVLSGLVSTDVPAIIGCYAPHLGGRPEIFERGVWRTLVWKRSGS